ncbi:MAG: Holliday junction resolvase RuvX [Bacteroidota bacterium]|nr:Holliday junction resolvase RuvX [Bacteroidota bacterium]
MPRILAIDYGTKRVGLAVTDPLQLIANTLGTVRTHEAIAYLKTYLQKEEVVCFVVGKPLKMDGTDSQSAQYVEKFISLLAKTFPIIPIKRVDERFTSRIAQRALLEMGLKKKDRQKKENVDQVSAVLILQTYLENKF